MTDMRGGMVIVLVTFQRAIVYMKGLWVMPMIQILHRNFNLPVYLSSSSYFCSALVFGGSIDDYRRLRISIGSRELNRELCRIQKLKNYRIREWASCFSQATIRNSLKMKSFNHKKTIMFSGMMPRWRITYSSLIIWPPRNLSKPR